MRFLLPFIALLGLAVSAVAAPIPRFDDPKALLDAVYDGFLAMEDWDNYDPDAHFAEEEAFSARLSALHRKADDIVNPNGDEMGALDFSPFIFGQDSGGLSYAVGTPRIKGSRAKAKVDIISAGEVLHTIGFELVHEGEAGWKVDDIILPEYDSTETWRLSDYFADPLASF